MPTPTEAGADFRVRSQPFYCGSRSWHELHPTSGNRSGFRGWLSGFRPRQLAVPSRKPRWHRPRSRCCWRRGLRDGSHSCPTTLVHFWTFVVVARLSEYKCGSPRLPGFSARNQTCSSKLQQQARDLALLNAPNRGLARHEWRSTRLAPPLCKQGVTGSSPVGSTPSWRCLVSSHGSGRAWSARGLRAGWDVLSL